MIRNNIIDIVRGLAMLMVVLGHTISGCTTNYEDSLIYKIIWSLQMPLFIIISGYLTKYSKKIESGDDLFEFLKKRTFAYLLPWGIWTFLIRGIVFGQETFTDLKFILWHMDAGYWFLVAIWLINVQYGIVSFLTNKINIRESCKQFVPILLSLVTMSILALVGYLFGFSFCAIKLTLYYTPIFFAGYLWGQIQNKTEVANNPKFTDTTITVSFLIWLYLIVHYDFLIMSDNAYKIVILRFVASLLGCISTIGFISRINSDNKWLGWVGKHSLEVYLSHYLFLNTLSLTIHIVPVNSLTGGILVLSNYLFTIVMTIGFIRLIQSNAVANFVLFYKKTA